MSERLDDKGRCCGRKPIQYRREHPSNGKSGPYQFCSRCDRAFDPEGRQMKNWAWRVGASSLFERTF